LSRHRAAKEVKIVTTANLPPIEERAGWYGRAPWLILVAGLLVALIVTALLFLVLMQPPTADLRALISTLALTSLFSLGLGALLYRRGWARSMSLMRTLTLTYVWAALLTFFNVGILQREMFVSEHDLILGSVLLLFAAIIATTFGVFVSAGILRQSDAYVCYKFLKRTPPAPILRYSGQKENVP